MSVGLYNQPPNNLARLAYIPGLVEYCGLLQSTVASLGMMGAHRDTNTCRTAILTLTLHVYKDQDLPG